MTEEELPASGLYICKRDVLLLAPPNRDIRRGTICYVNQLVASINKDYYRYYLTEQGTSPENAAFKIYLSKDEVYKYLIFIGDASEEVVNLMRTLLHI